MGCRCKTLAAVLVVAIAGGIAYLCPDLYRERQPPQLVDEYFGKGPLPSSPSKYPKDDIAIKKFEIKVDDFTLKDLKERLSKARFVEPVEGTNFRYGFHPNVLKKVIDYWSKTFDWRKQEKELNKFNHYTTQIEGINIHYIHHKPTLKANQKLRVIPLLLVHGWPGSVVEFVKILPLLTTPKANRDYVFEVICPSIPGYGYSEAPHQKGFSISSAARVFRKLMDRLGHKEFYAQGGDWGSAIVTTIAKVYPDRVLGVHVNMLAEHMGIFGWAKYAVGYFFPNLYTTPAQYDRIYPFTTFCKFIFEEMGYMMIQATKPDTVGAALTDSPVGLAAYILEKYSTWTDRNNRDLPEGALTKKFTMDELLTNIMVYWTTNSTASSMRFYKENFSEKERNLEIQKVPIKVPLGVAAFPDELLVVPKEFYSCSLRKLVRYSIMSKGGHFAAFEEPQLLAVEIWDFIVDVENSKKETK